jgi:putative PIN family toxin of toxin-antitoxin system
MRLVLDTNVLVAALVARGTCNELIEHVALRHTWVTSEILLTELRDVLTRKFRYTAGDAREAAALVRSRAMVVVPAALPAPVCRDADDDRVLATAVAGECVCLITGDADLLVLARYKGICILKPSDFWAFESA